MMRVFIALVALFAGACSTSLPKLPAKRVAFPAISPQSADVTEWSEVLRDERRNRDVPIRTYSPANARERLPVVVFSHGIGENRDSYAWLGRALAHHGFFTVHVTHARSCSKTTVATRSSRSRSRFSAPISSETRVRARGSTKQERRRSPV